MKLLIHPAVEPQRLEKIIAAAGDMKVVNAADGQEALGGIPSADAFFGKLTPELLAAAGRLRWVQAPTASLEHYLFPQLVEHSCTLTNMRGIYSDIIADHVLGFIICFARNFHVYIRQQLSSHWEPVGGEEGRSDFISGPGMVSSIDQSHIHLGDATLGIVGLGGIGREVARRGMGFGMRIVAVDPVQTLAPEGVARLLPPAELDQLLAQSDFVVIAAPHTPQTEGLFGARQFRQMRSSAYLINVGRGAIVKLDDLATALQTGEIAGAGLDVFQIEPLPADHRLWQMPNVIITPHIAACSPRVAERHLGVLLENIDRFVHQRPLINVASKTDWF